jgi:UDP-N-acetylmuramoyl-L-alanyl-D-glutamate--2,6-diaminopimelate ligase
MNRNQDHEGATEEVEITMEPHRGVYGVRNEVSPMMLSKLLEGVTVAKMFQTVYGQMVVTHDVEVHGVQYDSRKIERGDLFVALRGTEQDGHRFIADAVEKGAKVAVLEDDQAMPDSYFMHAGVVKIVVPDSRIALAQLSAAQYGNPSLGLQLVGVTGTNGKTTTAYLLKSILESSGSRSGLIGTIEYAVGDRVIPATHTTPESLELNGLLAAMVAVGCTSAVMEVSSHALLQHRVHGLRYRAAVFTNLTQDHLDYHGTMEKYFEAKKILFENLEADSWAIVNIDDEWGGKMLEAARGKTLTYGIQRPADLRATKISLSMNGTNFTIVHSGEETAIETPLVGRFNVSNILAAFGTGLALGVPKAAMQQAVRTMKAVRGRFEAVASPRGWTAVVDYAHTPDALEKTLIAVRDVIGSGGGRIVTVFGCGGNRDRTKRPKMARVATRLSDITVVTSDNPRHEDPGTIIDEIMAGVQPGSKVYRETDRSKAIGMALGLAGKGDVVLIAGKGHETYQVIGDRKFHFNDAEVVDAFVRSQA